MTRRLNRWGVLAALALCCAGALVVTSCGGRQRAKPDEPAAGIEKTYERGPMTVRLLVDRSEVTLADRIRLTIEAKLAENYEMELPNFGEKLEQFGIVDFRTSLPKLVGTNQVLVQKTYVLEPFLSGDYKIPSMKIFFWEKGQGLSQKHEIETEELTITVKSLLPEKLAELKINDITPPGDLPRSTNTWIWAAVGVSAAALAGIVLYFSLRRRAAAPEAAPTIPPGKLAFRELEALIGEDLIKKGEIKAFYQRLSNILRVYIEGRFGLHAPEQTTEEFLAELRTRDTLMPRHRDLLKTFLGHCDMVKFAEHQPATAEIQKAFDSCKEFITETGVAQVDPSRTVSTMSMST